MQSLTPNLENWLKRFAQAVRERDYIAGRKLFDESVVSFGTVCYHADKLDELVAKQWRIAWPNTKDFDFDYASAGVLLEAEQAVVITHWHATGSRRDGTARRRRGRATIVLQNDASGWKAVHTHYSLLSEQGDDSLPEA
jgi:ketosteroid isomerase-like protein